MGEAISAVSLAAAKSRRPTPEDMIILGNILGGKGKDVAIGIDMDPSSMMMRNALVSGLLAVGTNVWDAGVMPAPAVLLSAKNMDCTVMIGSPDSTGKIADVVMYDSDGAEFNNEMYRNIITRYNEHTLTLQDYKNVGKVRPLTNVAKRYIGRLTKGRDAHGSPIILDCGCNCTAKCAPQVLAGIGCDLVCLNGQVDPEYRPRQPGISKTDISDMNELVAANLGTVGIALNGNGTRMALIDEGGRYISPEETLALLLLYLKPSVLVIPVDSTSLITDAFWGNIGKIKTDVQETGSRKIIKTDGSMEATTSALKDNGGLGVTDDWEFIYADHSLCPDGILTGTILSELSGSNSIRNTTTSFPKYVVLNDVVRYAPIGLGTVKDQHVVHSPTANREMFSKKIDNEISKLDCSGVYTVKGWRVELEFGWFSISFSTDSDGYVDIVSEAKDKAYAVCMMEQAKEMVIKCL